MTEVRSTEANGHRRDSALRVLIFAGILIGVVVIVLRMQDAPLLPTVDDGPDSLRPGVYQAEVDLILLPNEAETLPVDGAALDEAVITPHLSFDAYGTDLLVRWRAGAALYATDCLSQSGGQEYLAVSDDWQLSTVHLSLWARFHPGITLSGTADYVWIDPERGCVFDPNTASTLTLDTIQVLDRTLEHLFPLAAALLIAVGMTLWVIRSARRGRGL
jgi:hypothetical protein